MVTRSSSNNKSIYSLGNTGNNGNSNGGEDELKIRLIQQQPQISKLTTSRNYILLSLVIALILLNLISNLLLYFQPKSHSTLTASKLLKIGTLNIRYDPKSPQYTEGLSKFIKRDWSSGFGESPWKERREHLMDSVVWEGLDIVGLQEVLHNQMNDVISLLGEGYGHVGVGRNDGKKDGEYVPLFYKKERLELLSVKHFWLSDTPDIPGSISWDVGLADTRMVTLATFRDKYAIKQIKNNQFVHSQSNPPSTFSVLNTHWDDRSEISRRESAKLILKKVEELTSGKGQEELIIAMGDLNSHATEEGYRIMTGYRYARSSSSPDGLSFVDCRKHLSTFKSGTSNSISTLLSSPWGDRNTYSGFLKSDTPKIIDFILLLDNAALASYESNNGIGWRVNRFGVVPNQFDDDEGRRMILSDHRLVVAGLEWVG